MARRKRPSWHPDRRTWFYKQYGILRHGWGGRFSTVKFSDPRYTATRKVFGVLVWNQSHAATQARQ